MESGRLRERAKVGLDRARQAAGSVLHQMISNPDVIATERHQREIEAAREANLKFPDFDVLKVNIDYRKWLTDSSEPKNPLLDRVTELQDSLFANIRAGKSANPYGTEHGYDRMVLPDLPEAELHQKCVEFCRGTAQRFIVTATAISSAFASGEHPADEPHMLAALNQLTGADLNDQGQTIYHNQKWRQRLNCVPDHVELGVEPAELEVPQEKIMAGIGLAMGLWIRLGDAGASYPGVDRSFGPAANRWGFISLVIHSDWHKHTNSERLFLNATQHVSDNQQQQDEFYAPFRDPAFFADTLAVLQATE